MSEQKKAPEQLQLPLIERGSAPAEAQAQAQAHSQAKAPRPGLKLLKGGGVRRQEKLGSRDAVVRVLLEAGADLLLRRISPERAEEIEGRVDRLMDLFDKVDAIPALFPKLERELNELEALMTETRERRVRRAP